MLGIMDVGRKSRRRLPTVGEVLIVQKVHFIEINSLAIHEAYIVARFPAALLIQLFQYFVLYLPKIKRLYRVLNPSCCKGYGVVILMAL